MPLHSGEKIGGTVCKCMACAELRWKHAARHARIHAPLLAGDIQRVVDRAELEAETANQQLREAKSIEKDFVQRAYDELQEANS